jgi:glycosyltransferase involved in cell wall biosynthesis
MSIPRAITFVVATYGADDVLNRNFLSSPGLVEAHGHQIIIQRDYASAAKAYNDAIDHADNDLMVFAHNDMIFPEPWLDQLEQAITFLDGTDPAWGVLGCCGVAHDGSFHVWAYHPTQGLLGKPFDLPVPVQTLDEIILIFRKRSGLRFDENLPYFHLYGTDICMRAAKQGMKNYAIPAYCIHNASYHPVLPKEFYRNYRYIRKTWKADLPIHTSCQLITKQEFPLYRRRMHEIYLKLSGKKLVTIPRVTDTANLVKQATAAREAL